jgi:hypothetical protein
LPAPPPQSHSRRDPAYHYVVIPTLLGNLVYRLFCLLTGPSFDRLWSALVAVALVTLAVLLRLYALRVQDRVIRMEERIRIAAVASPETLARMDEFSIEQFAALRFAPWSELGPLADRAVREQLSSREIKESIIHWRSDTHRV